MAPRDVLGSPQRSQSILWPVASNDHYCPDEATCRHAVIDISSKDTRGPIHYLAAYSDRRIVWSPLTHSEALMRFATPVRRHQPPLTLLAAV